MKLYKHNKPYRDPHNWYGLALAIAIVPVLLFGGWWLLINHQAAKEESSGQRSVITESNVQAVVKPEQIIVNKDRFSFNLPQQWVEVADYQDENVRYYEWQNQDPDNTAQSLRLYINSLPRAFAVNKILPVVVDGARLEADNVSENCAEFTEDSTGATGTVNATWKGIKFACDKGNRSRNVIATATVEEGLSFSVTDGTNAKTGYTFVYTDHTARPTNTPLTEAIKSFVAK